MGLNELKVFRHKHDQYIIYIYVYPMLSADFRFWLVNNHEI